MTRLRNPDSTREHAELSSGWLPHHLRHQGAEWVLDGCHRAGRSLDEPFFDPAIRRLLHEDPRTAQAFPLSALVEVPPRDPAGFVFHWSRSGSTLVSQLLAEVRELVVFSEPALLETLLRGTPPPGLFEKVLHAFASPGPTEQRAIVKFSARAVFDAPRIRAAFPAVPCVFVYRDPVEVLASLVGSRTERLPPGLADAGLLEGDPLHLARLRPAQFWSRVLVRQATAVLELPASLRPLLVNYQQLPEAVWTTLAGFFGVTPTADELAAMRQRLTRSAKAPERPFGSDQAAKQAAATAEIREFAGRLVRPFYDHLEALRQEGPSGRQFCRPDGNRAGLLSS